MVAKRQKIWNRRKINNFKLAGSVSVAYQCLHHPLGVSFSWGYQDIYVAGSAQYAMSNGCIPANYHVANVFLVE